MESESPGVNVTRAVRLLRLIHRDVATMLETIDKLMNDAGREPYDEHRVGDVANTLRQHQRWLTNGIYRAYVPKDNLEMTDEFIELYIEFEPPSPWVEPVVILVAARFNPPFAPEAIWRKWGRDSFMEVLGTMRDCRGTDFGAVAPLTGFLPPGGTCTALVMPLCDLRDATSVSKSIVQPALAAVQGTR